MDRIRMREKLEKKLDKKRFEHSLGVSYTAASIAMQFHVDVEKAAIAGLLHDCAKYFSSDEKLERCKKRRVSGGSREERKSKTVKS